MSKKTKRLPLIGKVWRLDFVPPSTTAHLGIVDCGCFEMEHPWSGMWIVTHVHSTEENCGVYYGSEWHDDAKEAFEAFERVAAGVTTRETDPWHKRQRELDQEFSEAMDELTK